MAICDHVISRSVIGIREARSESDPSQIVTWRDPNALELEDARGDLRPDDAARDASQSSRRQTENATENREQNEKNHHDEREVRAPQTETRLVIHP